MKTFIQVPAKKRNPKHAGWYNTDKGSLFWFTNDAVWSCRDDRISAEYPSLWYEEIAPVMDEEVARKAEECAGIESELVLGVARHYYEKGARWMRDKLTKPTEK